MSTDKPVDLDALEAAHTAATPGEWVAGRIGGGPAWTGSYAWVRAASGEPITEKMGVTELSLANARAIVALHNAAPALFAEVRRLRARTVELESATATESRGKIAYEVYSSVALGPRYKPGAWEGADPAVRAAWEAAAIRVAVKALESEE